ncbi:MAG: endonuclease/exonuclease/phosphatase family protein [Holosporaceae bacterium]|jgi:exodeoxyribonuclease-3|nr:endonuclease/exonuclease/phosphatase family protein [Holosporaceae bacterium]
MKIISWNVNSIRARIDNFLIVASKEKPDIILLQETRVENSLFPREPLEELGYNIAMYGQKGRNGVAICSKYLLEEVTTDFSKEARYIEAFTGGLFVASIYVPNGQEVDTEQYFYKLDFLKKLKDKFLFFKNEIFIAGGDYNVAPYPKDIYIVGYEGIAGSPRERHAMEELRATGYLDPLENNGFTWWSYRRRDFQQDDGFRIDQFYLSPQAQKLFSSGGVLRYARGLERPSDHAPIFCIMNLHP